MERGRYIVQAVILGATIAFVWLATYCVAAFYETGVPLENGLELWRINAAEGWSLVVPRNGTVHEELVSGVTAIARLDGGFIVERGETSTLLVSQVDASPHYS